MILCKSCGRVSVGNPPFCEGCGKSFNATLCQSKHVNPATASHCSTCGSDELSTPTRGVKLQWVSKVVSLAVVLVALKVLLPLMPTVLGALIHALTILAGWVLGPLACLLLKVFVETVALWILTWLIIRVIFGAESKFQKGFERLSARSLHVTGGLCWGLLKGLARLTFERRRHDDERK